MMDSKLSAVKPFKCGHCSGPYKTERGYVHDNSCIVMLGIDEITARDKQFFEDHPEVDGYYRPITLAEGAQLRAAKSMPTEGTWVGKVYVRQIRPGTRTRDFGKVRYIVTPDDLR